MAALKSAPRPEAPRAAAPRTEVICYDTETSDADVRHGQILQFAAVTSGDELQVRGEHNLRVRRLPYVVPSPQALQVTGIDPRLLDDPALPDEYTASLQIQNILRQATPSVLRIFLTFNGIKFDDEIIRTTLFRNLRDPWVTSGKNTTRVDALRLVQMVLSADPKALALAQHEETGKTNWKLESLCRGNGIEIDAHDALGDTRATLDLVRHLRERCPWAWRTAVACGNAGVMDSRLANSAYAGRVVWHFTHYGEPDVAPCLVLGTDGRKGWLLADLRFPAVALPKGPASLSDVAFSPEAPLRVVRSGSAPMLLADEDVARFPLLYAPERMQARADDLRSHRALIDLYLRLFRESSYDKKADATPEERIYDAFTQDEDRRLAVAFHAEPWHRRADITFRDDRLNDFAARLVLMNAKPRDLGAGVRDRLERACRDAMARPHGDCGCRWETLARARQAEDGPWSAWADGAFGAEAPREQLSFGI